MTLVIQILCFLLLIQLNGLVAQHVWSSWKRRSTQQQYRVIQSANDLATLQDELAGRVQPYVPPAPSMIEEMFPHASMEEIEQFERAQVYRHEHPLG